MSCAMRGCSAKTVFALCPLAARRLVRQRHSDLSFLSVAFEGLRGSPAAGRGQVATLAMLTALVLADVCLGAGKGCGLTPGEADDRSGLSMLVGMM